MDWSGISLKTGQGACPSGVTETNTDFLSITQGPRQTEVNLGITSLSRGQVRNMLSSRGKTILAMDSSFPIDLYVYDKDDSNSFYVSFGKVDNTPIENRRGWLI